MNWQIFILIDTGAGISDQVLEFVMASPEVLLVSTPEPSSLTDAYSLLKALYCNPDFVEEETIHPHSNQPGKFPGRGTGNL